MEGGEGGRAWLNDPQMCASVSRTEFVKSYLSATILSGANLDAKILNYS